MSTHEVLVVKVENIRNHPNADSLEFIDVYAYQCIVRKGLYKLGDLIAFIQPDTLVPLARPEFSFLDKGKGREFERIALHRFRGERSYGLIVPAPEGSKEGDNVMEQLGCQHYEPPQHGAGFGKTGFLSGQQEKGPDIPAPHYDLENYKKFHKLFAVGEPVIYTDKIHGTSARYVFHGGRMYAGSRTTWKKPPGTVETITYTVRATGEEVTKDISSGDCCWWLALEQNPWIKEWCEYHPDVVLYGECYGGQVQGAYFKYGKEEGQYGFACFDILDHGKWVNNADIIDNPHYSYGLGETVKVVYRGPHDPELLKKLAEESDEQLYPGQKIREGIVVKPEVDRYDLREGRVALKYVSDVYLEAKWG